MPKFSQIPTNSSPTNTDYTIGVTAGNVDQKVPFSSTAALMFTQTNIPAGSGSPITRDDEMFFDFVQTGLVWSGDAYASTRVASMTAGTVYINGRRLLISAVVSRTFTASKDTYVDILDNQDGTGTIVYTEVTNNAASPALAANSLRIAIIVTGATTIASVGSVNQGQEDRILPIASSIPYSVSDSLGNPICPRNPAGGVIGYRQMITDITNSAGTIAAITGLSVPVIVPANRRIKFTVSGDSRNQASGGGVGIELWDGTLGSGTRIQLFQSGLSTTTDQHWPVSMSASRMPTAGLHTYNLGLYRITTGTAVATGTATSPFSLMIEVV